MQSDKLTVEDLTAIIRGACGALDAIRQVFPDASPEEIQEKLYELRDSKAGVELLHQVLMLRKLKVG